MIAAYGGSTVPAAQALAPGASGIQLTSWSWWTFENDLRGYLPGGGRGTGLQGSTV